jgi:methanol--5-hydroxybenzimidazolylcobamide Co-methyltransferase
MFSGSAPQAFLEMLHYDTKLMNQAQKEGKALILRDLLVNSDKFSDPQAFVLAPDTAWCIGEAIVSESGNEYRRTIKAGEKALDLILASDGLALSESEQRFGQRLRQAFSSLPAELEDFIPKMISTYVDKVPTFRPGDYEL